MLTPAQYTDWSRLDSGVATSATGGARPSSPHYSPTALAGDAQSTADLLTDAIYAAPAIDVATLHSVGPSAPTFLYVFNYTSATSAAAASASISGLQPSSLIAPSTSQPPTRFHRSPGPALPSSAARDLLMYALGAPVGDGIDPFPSMSFSRHDRLVSETVMKYWTNFIKTGYGLCMLMMNTCVRACVRASACE
jgi:Carboxylesterase family